MSLFRKRGPSAEDVARENEIKRNITQELSSAIRTLQREHHKKSDAILSTETANTVCNVLEAIFLHGLKDSVTKKLVSYISLNQSDTAAAEQTVNFWQFANKFTHSDVTAQLKRLGQITTEVGLCRAWVRVALNDCLMESYVDSMLADKKTLEYFYHRLAYLRDLEHPEIFKSYLKGLMSFEFELSFNSRLLNSWTNPPLLLSGIIQADNTPLPVIHPDKHKETPKPAVKTSPEEKYSELDNGLVDVRTIRTKSRSSSSENETLKKSSSRPSRTKKHRKSVPSTPPNTPYDGISAALTRNDVEEIRKLRRSSSPHGTGTSDSSHISYPDPVQYNLNPTAYIESKLKEENVFHLCDDQDEQTDGGSKPQSFTQVSVEQVPSLENVSPKFHSNNNELVEEQAVRNDLLNERILQDILNESDSDTEKIPAIDFFASSGLPLTSSASDIPVLNDNDEEIKSSGSVENDMSVIGHVINSCDKKINTGTKPGKRKGTKTRLKPDLSPPNKGGVPPELSTASAITIETTKSRSPRPKGRLSMPNIGSIEITVPTRSLGTIEAHSEPDLLAVASENSDAINVNKAEGDEHSTVNSPGVGNSLGARSGWSSSFDLEAEDRVNEMPAYIPSANANSSRIDGLPAGRPKAESFGTLLQNYTPSSSGVTSPSVDDVLQNFPEITDTSPNKRRMSPVQANMDGSSDIDEYEIVSAYSFPSLYSLEKLDRNMENKLNQLSELATEKGLDSQNYQCGGCKRPIGLIYGKPRVCSFDGAYYCFECHENDEYYIPAAIIHNWDFRKHIVSKQNLTFLQDTEDQAFINIFEVNPKLYEHVREMEEVNVYRNQLVYLKTYLFTCKQSIAEELRRSVWPKEYMYDNIHMYSLGDLLQIPTGQLQTSLKKIIKFATKHVYECRLCSQKGFICELCNNQQVIYPFQIDATVRCLKCKSVFHKTCKTEAQQCPKCQRREIRKSFIGSELQTPDIDDYAYSPHR